MLNARYFFTVQHTCPILPTTMVRPDTPSPTQSKSSTNHQCMAWQKELPPGMNANHLKPS